MFDDIDYEKLDNLFESNKGNVYFFSVESLETIDDSEGEHLFFQNVINKNITREEFIFAENKINAFLEYLFIKSDKVHCFSEVCQENERFQKLYYVKKSKDVQIYFNHILNDINMCVEINDINALKGFTIIGDRDIGYICFYFENLSIAVMVNDCQGLIYFKDIENAKEFLDAAKRIGLNTEKWKC